MIKSLKLFVSLNKKFCVWLDKKYPNFFLGDMSSTSDLKQRIHNTLIEKRPNVILEVGGIDRPLLNKNSQYKYIGLDIENCNNCYEIYDEFIVDSIEQKNNIKADLIISTTLLEHVKNNSKSLSSMYQSLKKGGQMHHYVPMKNHPYSIALRIVGPNLQKILIKYLRPHAQDVTGYPAFFNLCSKKEMKRALIEAGFQNIKITTYYKATDYFSFFFPAYIFIAILENIFEYFGYDYFGAGMVISASK